MESFLLADYGNKVNSAFGNCQINVQTKKKVEAK